MSHFAKVENNLVTQVIVAEADFITTGALGDPAAWIQTSYNTRGGVHYGQDGQPDSGEALRANYAGIGYTYDTSFTQDGVVGVFYAPQPYASWILNTTTFLWEAPVPYPNDGKTYVWDEATQSWVEVQNV